MIRKTTTNLKCLTAVAMVLALGAQGFAAGQAKNTEKHVAVTFTGGYDTDQRDRGRPVVLIAAALGVPTETFRRAFSGVTPARGSGPTQEEARRNKDALMSVLEPLGVTNDRLDEVSNYYRYRREQGEMWRNTPAEGYAIVSKGKIVGLKITNAGSGYSSTPTISIPGFESLTTTVTLKYTKDFDTNGSISELTVTPKKGLVIKTKS